MAFKGKIMNKICIALMAIGACVFALTGMAAFICMILVVSDVLPFIGPPKWVGLGLSAGLALVLSGGAPIILKDAWATIFRA